MDTANRDDHYLSVVVFTDGTYEGPHPADGVSMFTGYVEAARRFNESVAAAKASAATDSAVAGELLNHLAAAESDPAFNTYGGSHFRRSMAAILQGDPEVAGRRAAAHLAAVTRAAGDVVK